MDGLFDRPDRIWVDPQAVLWKGRGQRMIHLDLMRGWENSGLELVRRKAVTMLKVTGMGDNLIGRCLATAPGRGVAVAEEQV